MTGGLGDLGLRVARWMVDRGARQILLLSRTEMPPRAHWPALAAEDSRFAERVDAIEKMKALVIEGHAFAVPDERAAIGAARAWSAGLPRAGLPY